MSAAPEPTAPGAGGGRSLRLAVFALTAAAYTQIYLTQPVLPVIQTEFTATPWAASLTVSLVIGGIALGQVLWGALADRLPMGPIISVGALLLAGCGLAAALAASLPVLAAARLGQGLFIPAVSTCLAAYLAKNLPAGSLAVVMGSYVSATVCGGLLSRITGGMVHWAMGWRWSFVLGAVLVLAAAACLLKLLPRSDPLPPPPAAQPGYRALLRRPELLKIYATVMGAFFVFASIYNYMPFYLAGPPFGAPTEVITLIYLSFLMGVGVGPAAGRLHDRLGDGPTVMLGTAVMAGAVALTLVPSGLAVGVALAGICLGFFVVHAACTAALNQRLTQSQGRANSLYVMFYYIAGYLGITVSGWAYDALAWPGVVFLGLAMLLIPMLLGWAARRSVPL